MEERSGRRIILERHNWELPALISLVSAVAASLYAVTPSFIWQLAGSVYLVSLASGLVAIWRQIRAAKATIVNFTKEDWRLDGDDLVLEIESDFMLFRIETRKDTETFQEVIGGSETTEDGKVTRVCFSSGIPDEHLAGRVVVR